jgi:general stress protein 26
MLQWVLYERGICDMKKVIKFSFEGKEGFLSLVEIDHKIYALVKKDTPKVQNIIRTNQLLISYELKQNPTFMTVEAHVSYDFDTIQKVYSQLEMEKNLYFKTLDDTLCVIEIVHP